MERMVHQVNIISKYRKNHWLVSGTLYILLLLLVYAPVFFGGKSLYPYTPGRPNNQVVPNASIQKHLSVGGTYYDEGASDWIEIPMIEEMGDSLRRSESLLWDSYSGLGLPVVPNSSAATTAPFSIIPVMFQSDRAWDVMYVLRIWFMMFFTYAFLRELWICHSTAFLTGGLFGLCGYCMYHMNMFHFNVDAFLPCLMFVTARYRKKQSFWRFGFLAFTAGMMMLGGNPQNLITGTALAVLFFFVQIWQESGEWKEKTAACVKYCLAYFVAALGTMYFWLPFLELFQYGFNYHTNDSGLFSIPLTHLLGLLFPGIYVSSGAFFVYLCYVGVGVLPVILLFTNWKDKARRVFFVFVILYLLKLTGCPLLQWIGHLPVLGLVYYWKYSCSLYFAIFVLFAYACEDMRQASAAGQGYKARRLILWIYYGLCIAAAVVIYIYITKNFEYSEKLVRWKFWLILLSAVWLSVLVCGRLETLMKTVRGKSCFRISVMVSICVEIVVVPCCLNNYRVDHSILADLRTQKQRSLDAEAVKKLQAHPYDRISTVGMVFMGNMSSYYGLYNTAALTAVPVAYYYDFMKELVLENGMDIHMMDTISGQYHEGGNKYLDLMGVSHVVADNYEELESETLRKVYSNGSFSAYENEGYFDKAFYVYDYKQLEKKEEIFAFLRGLEDLSKTVVIETEDKLPVVTNQKGKNAENEVNILKYKDGQVEISCSSSEDGFLVLNDLYYPGWKAYVDGKETKIYKTDYVLRGIWLEKGEHIVTYVYRPISFYAGLCISALTVLVYVTLAVIRFLRFRHMLVREGVRFQGSEEEM